MEIRPVTRDDHSDWLRMRQALWPDCPAEKHEAEMARIAIDPASQAVFVAVRSADGLGGLVEVSLRPNAAGCETQPVGYIEGWYVEPDLRQRGVGRGLLAAAEAWARTKGCCEMASDTDFGNETSVAAHLAAGYEGAGRSVHFHFRKRLR